MVAPAFNWSVMVFSIIPFFSLSARMSQKLNTDLKKSFKSDSSIPVIPPAVYIPETLKTQKGLYSIGCFILPFL
jgi:hypothetical protein